MDRAMRVKKFAETLSCSVPTVRRLIRKGHLPRGTKLPGSRVVVWFEEDISEVIENLKSKTKLPVLPSNKTWRTDK